jgi:phosphoglycolate phosphatase-like HAD superfamily hydrolase
MMKPNPAPVLDALARLGAIAASTVLIGDSATDINAAHAGGVRCIALANRPHKHEVLRAAGADAVIVSMSELI